MVTTKHEAKTRAVEGRPIQQLTAYLRIAIQNVEKTGPLIIPPEIVGRILPVPSPPSIGEHDLREIVTLLGESSNSHICCKFDVASFNCLLLLILHANPCSARDRSLGSFLASIRRLSEVSQSKVGDGIAAADLRKSSLCENAGDQLLNHLASPDRQSSRRWSGQFVYELIRGTKQNQIWLMSTDTRIRQIVGLLESDNDQIVRIMAAAIIRQLVVGGFDIRSIPQIETWTGSLRWPANLMLTACTDSQWVESISTWIAGSTTSSSPATFSCSIDQIRLPDLITKSCPYPSALVLSSEIGIWMLCEGTIHYMAVPLSAVSDVRSRNSSWPELDIVILKKGYYTVDGIQKDMSSVTIRAKSASQAEKAGETIESLMDSFRMDRSAIRVSAGSGYGASCIISLNGNNEAGGVTPNSSLHDIEAKRKTLSSKNSRRRPSVVVVELPTRAQVLEQVLEDAARPPDTNVILASDQVIPETPDQESVQEAASSYPASHLEVDRDHNETAEEKGSCHVTQVVDGLPDLEDPEPQPQSVNKAEETEDTEDISAVNTSPATAKEDTCQVAATQDASPVDKSLATVEEDISLVPATQETSPVVVTPELVSDSAEVVPSPAGEAGVLEGQESNICTVIKSNPTNESCSMDVTTAVGLSKTQHETQPPDNSRLKRPAHKKRGAVSQRTATDWDLDLRVGPGEIAVEQSAPLPKEIPSNNRPSGRQKGTRRPAKSKLPPKKQLDLTPLDPASETTSSRKPRNQVAKTLTSTRQRRSAADEASRKMALITEQENASYDQEDQEDPIETSSPDVPAMKPPEHRNTVKGETPPPSGAGGKSMEEICHNQVHCSQASPIYISSDEGERSVSPLDNASNGYIASAAVTGCQSQKVDENGSPRPDVRTARNPRNAGSVKPLSLGVEGSSCSLSDGWWKTSGKKRLRFDEGTVSDGEWKISGRKRLRFDEGSKKSTNPAHVFQPGAERFEYSRKLKYEGGLQRTGDSTHGLSQKLEHNRKRAIPRITMKDRPRNRGLKSRCLRKKFDGHVAEEADMDMDMDMGTETDVQPPESDSVSITNSEPSNLRFQGRGERDNGPISSIGMDMMLDTSNRLLHQLQAEENAMFNLGQCFEAGCVRMIQQLEEVHTQTIHDRKDNLESTGKMLLSQLKSLSTRLDNGGQ
ncbi:hypothetical protein FQN57_002958 [Myotisia sp. PD_48]|nr:hypothetical protein FQN57_002958 [Myotisia sp. PD_48]